MNILSIQSWVAYGHVADFYDRNRDKEDDTATLRKRRERARDDVLKKLAQLARMGGVEPVRRTEIEASLMLLGDADLFQLKAELAGAVLSTARGVTRDGRRDGTGADMAEPPAGGVLRYRVSGRAIREDAI